MKQNINLIKQYEKNFWCGVGASLTPKLAKILSGTPLVVVDVGAAGGHEPRWLSLKGYAKFVEFEPDLRTDDHVASDTIRIPKALGAVQGSQTLHLTKFPAASSLFPINVKVLANYANFDCHEVVGKTVVELDTLDNCMQAYHLEPHFLKIDAEGAELDIMKGGKLALSKSILGLKVEVNMQERQKGAPLFGEIDHFLRSEGYELQSLSRDHWIRKNSVFSVNSQPQIVWADAVYFLSLSRFIESVSGLSDIERTSRLVHFVAILLCHGAHDLAIDVVQNCQGKVEKSILSDLTTSIQRSQTNIVLFVLKIALGCILWGMAYILSFPVAQLRKKMGIGLRTRMTIALQTVARWCSRGGPYRAHVTDVI